MGIHRLVLVLYQQLGRGTVFAPQVRQNFNLRNFARRFNLGKPVAATYFNCQRQTGTGGRRFTWVMDLRTPDHVVQEVKAGKLEPTTTSNVRVCLYGRIGVQYVAWKLARNK